MTSITFCNDASQKQILQKIEDVVLFLHHTRWIIEAYVSDFYTHEHWQKLGNCIQEFVDGTEPPDWAWLLDENPDEANKPLGRVIPLSLLALKSCSQYLSLRRTAIDLDSTETLQDIIHVLQNESSLQKACFDEKQPKCSVDCDSAFKAKSFQKPNYKNGQCMDMQHIFRKHVKPKKQHEIQKLGQIIQILSETSNCKSVIDVGAGLGHLSRLLTFLYDLKVTTIEAADGHAPKAAEFDRELKKDVLKKKMKMSHNAAKDVSLPSHQNEETAIDYDETKITHTDSTDRSHNETLTEENLPSHVVCYIEPDIAASQFLEIVKQAKLEGNTSKQTVDSDNTSFILAGLHTCGDLTPTLIKVFLNCPSAVALASVGCCYMKMNACIESERWPPDCVNLENYPLSSFLKAQECHSLNYECREMACHFADAYCQRLKDNPVHLKVHSYRAALQYLIKSISPDFASGQIRLVCKKGAQVPFVQYAAEVLKKLNIDLMAVPQDLIQQCEDMTLLWKRVVAFYTIRLSLAPVVETLILLDRIFFLKEMGINSALVPIFDSRLSPRNFALLAIKRLVNTNN